MNNSKFPRSGKSFASKYSGRACADCGNSIEYGQQIYWTKRGFLAGQAWHHDCTNPDLNRYEINSRLSYIQPFTEPVKSTFNLDLNPVSIKPEPSPIKIQDNSLFVRQIEFDDYKESNNSRVYQLCQDTSRDYVANNAKFKELESKIDSFSKAYREPLTINVVNEQNKTKVLLDNVHYLMPKLLFWTKIHSDGKRRHVYAWGPAGSGKSTAASLVAKALGLPYYYVPLCPQSQPSILFGHSTALNSKEFVTTVFSEAYTNGGVICLDELDNSSPQLATMLNSAIDNGHCWFPWGMVERHKDFICVATGNTNGRGRNIFYPERREFDSATIDRFKFIEWGYDETLETKLTLQINPNASNWLTWIRATRKYCLDNTIRLLVSPRASFDGAVALLDPDYPVSDIVDEVVFKGIDRDVKSRILNNNSIGGIR